MIRLIRLREPALELCRLKHIGDRERATLETVRILCLSELTQSAYCAGRRVSASTPATCSSPESANNTRRRALPRS
jgi:hypothetical protein